MRLPRFLISLARLPQRTKPYLEESFPTTMVRRRSMVTILALHRSIGGTLVSAAVASTCIYFNNLLVHPMCMCEPSLVLCSIPQVRRVYLPAENTVSTAYGASVSSQLVLLPTGISCSFCRTML